MTPNNREELVELMAEAMWQQDSIRACGMPRQEEWSQSSNHEYWIALASGALTALDTAGIDLVPRVATEEMIEAGANAIEYAPVSADEYDTWRSEARDGYTAMLSASPFRPA